MQNLKQNKTTLWTALFAITIAGAIKYYQYSQIYTPTAQIATEEKFPLKGKVIIITGASSGIGKAATKLLYALGAHVIMATRDEALTKKTIAEIHSKVTDSPGKLERIALDLTNLQSVKAFVDEFHAKNLALHVLINNAASSKAGKLTLQNGTETYLNPTRNHLAPFLLTELLLDDLKKTKGKVISTSSKIMYLFKPPKDIPVEAFLASKSPYSEQVDKIYQGFMELSFPASKAMVVAHMNELHNRLHESTGISFNSYCPGFTDTSMFTPWYMQLLRPVVLLFGKPPENAAQTILDLVANPKFDKASGNFYSRTEVIEPSAFAQDKQVQQDLRTASLKLVQPFFE